MLLEHRHALSLELMTQRQLYVTCSWVKNAVKLSETLQVAKTTSSDERCFTGFLVHMLVLEDIMRWCALHPCVHR